MTNVLRAGLYERVSTQEQAMHGYSIETQKANLEAHCKAMDYKIVGHYTDEGISGSKSPLKRPALSRLLEDVVQGKIDIVLFTKLDRWFRNVQEYYKVQEVLDKHNVPWKTILEDYNTATADGRLKVNIMLSVAANERERTSERINSVLEHKFKNKEAAFGGRFDTLGYKRQKDENGIVRLVKDPETQEMMTEFWGMVVKYQNLNKAGKHINLKYGLRRTAKLWRNTLNNELYTGWYRGVEGFCEPYIDRETWLKVKSKKIKKTQNNRVYLFTGLLICPNCGKVLCSTYKKTGSKEYKGYRCKYREVDICSFRKTISESKTEKYLLGNLEKLIQLEIESVEVEKTKQKKKPTTNIPALKEKLRKLNVMYMAESMTDNEYLEETTAIKALITKAEQETSLVEERDITPLKELLNTDFRGLYELMTLENKRRFWRGIIKEIHVEGNDVKNVIFL